MLFTDTHNWNNYLKFDISQHISTLHDVIIIGEWSKLNMVNLNQLPQCFFLASGLKVNSHKRKFYCLGVSKLEVDRLASILKCKPALLLFSYLGLPVGVNMNLAKHCSLIVDKFKARISN